jgi:hypothetical protein
MELRGFKCQECKDIFYIPPVYSCPKCGSEDLIEETLSGNGIIYSYTVVYVSGKELMDKVPFVVAVVELDEGGRVTTNIIDSNIDDIKIGERVKFSGFNNFNRPLFKLV